MGGFSLLLLVLVGFHQEIPLVSHLKGFISGLDEEPMNLGRKSHGGTLRGVLHLNGMRIYQMEKHWGLQLDQRALFWQKRRDRLAQVEQRPSFAIPVEQGVGMKGCEVCAILVSKQGITPTL